MKLLNKKSSSVEIGIANLIITPHTFASVNKDVIESSKVETEEINCSPSIPKELNKTHDINDI